MTGKIFYYGLSFLCWLSVLVLMWLLIIGFVESVGWYIFWFVVLGMLFAYAGDTIK